MATIRCTVEDCEYWGEGNYCTAESILVVGPGQTDIEADHHGEEAEGLPQAAAGSKEQTHCFTFEK